MKLAERMECVRELPRGAGQRSRGTSWPCFALTSPGIWCVAILLLVAPLARADDPGNFPKGTWTLTAYGAFAHSFTEEEAKLASGTVGVGYYVLDNFSLNAELSGYHNTQEGPNANIANFEGLIRHHLLHSGRFSLYLDGGAGLSIADHRTPYYGTYYNYILEFGTGATFQVYDNINLMGGMRYVHLSNADLEGKYHNPGINSAQIYVGLLFKF